MRVVFFCCVFGVVCSCSTRAVLYKSLRETEKELQGHMGFALYDPVLRKAMVDYHSDRYFTPASNTKILTFFTSLNVLGDSAIAIKYVERNDSLIFWGMGDPSFLYQNVFTNNRLTAFLANSSRKLIYSGTNFDTERMGPGWAWDDYPYYYQAERSALPIYGNLITVRNVKGLEFDVQPRAFAEHFIVTNKNRAQAEVTRDVDSNELLYYGGNANRTTWSVPFRSSDDLVTDLLGDTLKRGVSYVNVPFVHDAKVLKSVPLDSLYKVMMQDSDNFIAEQLLLQCAVVLSDTLNGDIAIKYAQTSLLVDSPDELQWVDGSGLSRYNLFTPRSVVQVWAKIYGLVPRERLFALLAVGGKSGTLKNAYKDERPYVFGKTGSLSNVVCLSGYVMTKKGKVLTFSFMNNNFVAPSKMVRENMERILKMIHEKY